ncbi:asparagine synthase B [Pseudoalteromonas ruthenica]|uniref:asparagine synthase (glutamine-hydrolyzing) n=1 Tax=Pseudoalteromonas ruthenica TaxID=151081 RepID=A0A0F4Q024_9GAMM|nr:asparagine synthase B [Pseudoalteromonas ruthenica]KJY99051.1 asparagine synthetase B [Pseudoalteromonas ruthenica]KJY99906.1 asparagine synthetase B [Pseudoalteromonas ruthenica]TMO85121.1 asparagine synthase B [Pseudoalteromonas ruthenica]TMO91782.1 asparagine synthase B [Pseudoalteromonas ruthenica]TMP00628.1 asparagine synthase B [Pseudoalteromonas ruthenica]
MCSIFAVLDIKSGAQKLREQAIDMSKLLRHRGPDWSGVYSSDNAILVHERLAIVGVQSGAQPLYNADRSHVLAVNGEIYNHQQLAETLTIDFDFQTQSDCEVILALYEQQGSDFLDDLNGIFAFCLYDERKNKYLIGRDHIGIVPLYTGRDEQGNFYVASELKALSPICNHIEEFPPGHYLDSDIGEYRPYYQRDWQHFDNVKNNPAEAKAVREGLEAAVKRQLMCDVPYGVLLSGGLDSSVISAITQKFASKRIEDNDASDAWWPRLHSFSIGLDGSPDLAAAEQVAKQIGTIHHPIHFTVQQGIDALKEVIYHLETYDVTTVRASTPMYLMARQIKAMGIKMVLSGEGADELFGGYLYFHKAPNAQEFHEELNRKVSKLHMFDCLRANKSMAAWGVEARVPFLDKEFVDTAMRINPEAKMCKDGKIEKHIIRQAFEGYLPDDVLWRQKEQFSDGVGYSWIDSLKDYVDTQVSDIDMANAHYRFPLNTPQTKEAYFYRSIFSQHFPGEAPTRCVPHGKSVACSTPEALAWDASFADNADPSGRAANTHQAAYATPKA